MDRLVLFEADVVVGDMGVGGRLGMDSVSIRRFWLSRIKESPRGDDGGVDCCCVPPERVPLCVGRGGMRGVKGFVFKLTTDSITTGAS